MSIADWTIKNYKLMLLATMLLLAVFVGFLAYKQATTGSIVVQGVEFRGGTQISFDVSEAPNTAGLEATLESKLGADMKLKVLKGSKTTISIETSKELDTENATAILNSAGVSFTNLTVQRIGAALGATFFAQAKRAIFLAFVLMALVVYVTFRTPVPSAAVVLAALSDVISAVVGMNIAGIDLSLASLAGLLIIIGYSVDTDILLTTRLLKSTDEEDMDAHIKSSMKTGITMTTCAIVAVLVLYLVSTSPVLDQIALVMMFGLFADIPFTWLQNVGILKLYLSGRGRKNK